MTPPMRVRAVNDAPVASPGRYVLYWMIAARRARSNFALDRAIEHARAPRAGRSWSSRRCAAAIRGRRRASTLRARRHGRQRAAPSTQPGVRYLPVRRADARGRAPACSRRSRGRGRRGRHRRLPLLLPAADGGARRRASAGAARGGRRQRAAADARRRPRLPDGVRVPPLPPEDARRRISAPCPRPIRSHARRCRGAPRRRRRSRALARRPDALTGAIARRAGRSCPIDHAVALAASLRGGAAAARAAARRVRRRAASRRYADERNAPRRRRDQRPLALPALRPPLGARGLRRGDARARAGAGALPRSAHRRAATAGGACRQRPRRSSTSSSPGASSASTSASQRAGLRPLRVAARRGRSATLAAHAARSARPTSTRSTQLDARRARTTRSGTPPSASSRATGRIHNYLRMLWGKKILEWSRDAAGRARDDDRAQQQVRRSTAATRTRTAASSGSSAATTAPGAPSGRSSARCAT